MFQRKRSVLIEGVSVHDGECFLALYFKNNRQFSFFVEEEENSQTRFTEHHVDLGAPGMFPVGDSDLASKNALETISYDEEKEFKTRLNILEKAGYQKDFVREENKATIQSWIINAKSRLKNYGLVNEVFDDIKYEAKRLSITISEPKPTSNCSIQ